MCVCICNFHPQRKCKRLPHSFVQTSNSEIEMQIEQEVLDEGLRLRRQSEVSPTWHRFGGKHQRSKPTNETQRQAHVWRTTWEGKFQGRVCFKGSICLKMLWIGPYVLNYRPHLKHFSNFARCMMSGSITCICIPGIDHFLSHDAYANVEINGLALRPSRP